MFEGLGVRDEVNIRNLALGLDRRPPVVQDSFTAAHGEQRLREAGQVLVFAAGVEDFLFELAVDTRDEDDADGHCACVSVAGEL